MFKAFCLYACVGVTRYVRFSKRILHISQIYRFTPVCMRLCRATFDWCEYAFHKCHKRRASRQYAYNYALWARVQTKSLLNLSQVYGLTSVFIRRCLIRSPLSVTPLQHIIIVSLTPLWIRIRICVSWKSTITDITRVGILTVCVRWCRKRFTLYVNLLSHNGVLPDFHL
jgi:hypothetical protein